jgi:hypothetical protein
MSAQLTALLGALWLAAGPPRTTPGVPEPRFLFDIATAIGSSESTWATLAYDRKHDELFAVFGGQVHVFNGAGMETYTFGGDGDLGLVERVAVLESGDLLLISSEGGRRAILRCDFAGTRLGTLELTGLPASFAGFVPDRILAREARVYLAQAGTMRLVVADLEGKVDQVLDLGALVRSEHAGLPIGLNGFWVGDQGDLLFTMPLAFTAFVMSPAKELRQFGSRGSTPGKFNVVGAAAFDEQGNVFLLDRLRSVVQEFDPDLKFVQEFGYRGTGPTNLVAPYDLAVGNGKIFVSQAGRRGVKVFQYDVAAEPPGGASGG